MKFRLLVGAALLFPLLLNGQQTISEDFYYSAWIKKRVANSQVGFRETIVVPFGIRGLGWGCDCPMYFVGDKPEAWVDPVLIDGIPGHSRYGEIYCLATGYFSGLIKHEQHDFQHALPQFIILDFKIIKNENSNIAPVILDTNNTPSLWQEIAGKWKLVKKDSVSTDSSGIFKFEPPNKFTYTTDTVQKGTWEIWNYRLYIHLDIFEPDFGDIIKVDNEEMILKKKNGPERIFERIPE